ncbi:cytochrome P460 family protein [Roseivirga sp. E12]|uniref:cytochrome P460 family protein n=1 Tax=Roseivirga sp. E12 TaxID=2819237 RepID=UPI001ABC664C|nr:cytochrome P460 family protein [Roseivirga sp. E12]MBO3698253.1 cytochrome P460 family protein [Roseivirga sp. E12]
MKSLKRKDYYIAVVLLIFISAFTMAMIPEQARRHYKFDKDGQLIRSSIEDYRHWVYVGTPVTPNDLNPPAAAFPDFHNVYIHPSDFKYYEKHGKWQDGTILVKELVTVGSTQAVSGKGYFQGEFYGLEATVKDSKQFPDEPGNWAYFSFGHELPLLKTAKAFPTASCNACHAAAAADTDFVFTQYYPVLRAVAK